MKKNKMICSICRHPGFKVLPYDSTRPFKIVFECNKCFNNWSWGNLGGEYINYAMNKIEAEAIVTEYALKNN